MKHLLITLIFIPFFLIGQNYSINSSPNNKLIIGIDNLLTIEGYTRVDSLNIEVFHPLSSRKNGRNQFVLSVTKPMKRLPIVLRNRSEIIDTIWATSERIVLYQFIKTKNYGLIKSGEHSLGIVQNIHSIELKTNIPSREKVPIFWYHIEIYNGHDIILSKTIKGKNLNHPDIVNALKRVKRNGVVEIKKIRARLPWDCGNRAKNFYLIAT